MIPSSRFRRLVILGAIVSASGAIYWLFSVVTPEGAARVPGQCAAALLVLSVFYASGPLSARFLAPIASTDAALRVRLETAIAAVPSVPRVFLYEHAEQEANTVGLLPRHARVYLTTSLVSGLSDAGLRGVLAHECAHVRERHVFLLYCYACCFVVGSTVYGHDAFFFGAFLVFLMLRRYCEFRADARAAELAGRDDVLAMLNELAVLYPTKGWHRWFSFASPYPTLRTRIRAIETGRIALL
ncbi:peptidase M48 [Burkholderia cepacia]|uniref:M48 family metallopeptidase n=1 Tax=Burkholderia cepacia TaxID=292 RepID=UPI00075E400E|nr:M48 family metallopeptidase [Burkholderia cepacia]KVV25056.1 peptidase M48 [Burkholderia cepacia]